MKRKLYGVAIFLAGAITALLLVGISGDAPAQIPGYGVMVQGTITPNNCVKWINSNTIADAGTTC